ncbi:alpha/beta hydrolase [Streptomyces sp. NPDC050617]|uniref:alpha/beta hydrolase n=1 Tax=Streptomyces sp. NPDC050617 TaxID=3154628 RepID=UPI003425AA0E
MKRLRPLRRTAAVAALAAATAAGLLAPVQTASAQQRQEPSGIDKFTQQKVRWEKCGVKDLDQAGARCASIRVPLDYSRPDGPTLSVGFSRIKATDTRHRVGLMMHNSGGPGGPTLDMPLESRAAMGEKLAARYDLIGMDPRGVGRSSPLHCGTSGHWLRSAGYDDAGFRAQARYEQRLMASCQQKYGKKMAYPRHFTTRNTARDMDLLRAVLGERKTSYFGVSYGTYLGAVYANMFPGHVDRLLLDSAMDPGRYGVQAFRDMGRVNEEFMDAWARWAAPRNSAYGFGDTPAKVRATVEGIARQAAREPLKVGPYTADGQQVPAAYAMMMSDDRDFAEAAKNIRILYDAAQGRTVEPTEALAAAFGRPDAAMDNQNSLQMSLICADRQAPRDLSWYRKNVEASRAKNPLYGPLANGVSPCAFWPGGKPAEPPMLSGNDVPGLIVQSTGDPRTSYANGQGLHRKMPNSRLITLKARVHGVYGTYQNACVDRQVNDYLSTGRLPAKDTTCEKAPAGR